MSGGVWAARRYDNPATVLTADSAPELRRLIRADYGEWLRTRS